MIRNWVVPTLLLSMLVNHHAIAQVFNLEPGEHNALVIPYDQISNIETKIYNLTADSMVMDWGLVENTCPATDWYWELCDWGHCFTYIPNSGEMLAVAPGSFGYIKLVVNPYSIDGAGTVHFAVYPDQQIELMVDVYFDLATSALAIDQFENTVANPYPNPARESVSIVVDGFCKIISSAGNEVLKLEQAGVRLINISGWPRGVYFITNQNGHAQKLVVE